MMILILSIVILSILLLLYYLYIPLPQDIYCRPYAQLIELVIRTYHNYPADLIELLFGASTRIRFTRLLFNHAHCRVRTPPYASVHNDCYDGIPVRVYCPKRTPSSDAAVVFFHGGGFCIMNTSAYDAILFALIKRLRIPIVSVEYRLSPEHLFPRAVEDCEKATAYLITTAYRQLNVNPAKIVVMGDSAGGNLAAVTAIRLRKRKHLPHRIKLQVLIYPLLQLTDMSLPSYQLYRKSYNKTAFLDPWSVVRFKLLYLGVPATRKNIQKMVDNEHISRRGRQNLASYMPYVCAKRLPPSFRDGSFYEGPRLPNGDEELYSQVEHFLCDENVAPLMADSLEDLPDALIITCGYDVIRDDGVLYAKRLEDAGVPTVWTHHAGAVHGMICFRSRIRSRMFDQITEFVQDNI